MPGAGVHWTLVFTAASLEHLAERNIEAADVVDAVYGRHGRARVRRTGRGVRQRWFVMAPLDTGELLTCVLRVASPRDLTAEPSSSRRNDCPRLQVGSIHRCASALVLASPWKTRCEATATGGQAREIGNASNYEEAQDPNVSQRSRRAGFWGPPQRRGVCQGSHGSRNRDSAPAHGADRATSQQRGP